MPDRLEPEPNPLDPRLFPVVLELPLSERLPWFLRVGLRYVWQAISYTPRALIYGLRNPSPRILSDYEFEERFDNTVFNKMIVPFSHDPGRSAADMQMRASPVAQAPVDEAQQIFKERSEIQAEQLAVQRFPDYMSRTAAAAARYFIADFSIFAQMPTFPGTYAAGTTALFKRVQPGARLDVVSIRVGDLVLSPGEGDAWELAKLFTMQAASIRLVFATHALLHFPEDSVNALTKDRLPPEHVLRQLLSPHLDLQLRLDQVVQTGFASPLHNHQLFPWCSHTGPLDGLVRQLGQVYLGVEGNPAYPTYHFKHPRRTPEEKYVNFLEAYYQTILRFVRKILTRVEDGDPLVVSWADSIAKYVPGFPDGENIFCWQDESAGVRNLDWAVATFIWDVSVGHTTDHYNMGLLDINENPMRIRVPPPTAKTSTFERDQLRNWADFFRYRMFWRMFLTSTTVYRLADVRYKFADAELRGFNDEFLADLQRTAEGMAKGEFIPLRDIARSVQF